MTILLDSLPTLSYYLVMESRRLTKRQAAWQGMNWIRPEKRLAIYLRDGLACCYCGDAIEQGATLTLDHIVAHSRGGRNEAANLVTCCKRCNGARGNRSWKAFAAKVAGYLNHGVTPEAIILHITTTRRRPVDVPAAKNLIGQRGGFSAACQGNRA